GAKSTSTRITPRISSVASTRDSRLRLLAGVWSAALFADEKIRAISDIKGRSVGGQGLGSNPPAFINVMAAPIGLDPKTDIRWVTDPTLKPIELFAAGKIDAFLGFPPEPQELRTRKIGHVLVNTAEDRPWSQYFCCMLGGNRDFVRRNPVATKR